MSFALNLTIYINICFIKVNIYFEYLSYLNKIIDTMRIELKVLAKKARLNMFFHEGFKGFHFPNAVLRLMDLKKIRI